MGVYPRPGFIWERLEQYSCSVCVIGFLCIVYEVEICDISLQDQAPKMAVFCISQIVT